MDGDFGAWTCNTNCCNPPPESCCCDWTSISFYFQMSDTGLTGYECSDCDTNPFLVSLTKTACPADLTDATALGDYLLFDSTVFCGGVAFADARACYNNVGDFLGDHFRTPTFYCVAGCFEGGWTGPCKSCEPAFDALPGTQPFASYVVYQIRAVAGFFTDGIINGCGLYINVIEKHYVVLGSTNCASATLYAVISRPRILLFNGPGDAGTPPENCCQDVTMPSNSFYCVQWCTANTTLYPACTAGNAIATIPHPEWGKISVC